MSEQKKTERTFVEQMEIAGNELVDRVRVLLEESNTRRVIVRDANGNELLTAPLTFGVVAGGIITVATPVLAALGAMAALVTRVKLEVIRTIDDETVADATAGAADERPPAGT